MSFNEISDFNERDVAGMYDAPTADADGTCAVNGLEAIATRCNALVRWKLWRDWSAVSGIQVSDSGLCHSFEMGEFPRTGAGDWDAEFAALHGAASQFPPFGPGGVCLPFVNSRWRFLHLLDELVDLETFVEWPRAELEAYCLCSRYFLCSGLVPE